MGNIPIQTIISGATVVVSVMATVVSVMLAMPTRAKLLKDIEIYKALSGLTLTKDETANVNRLRSRIGIRLAYHTMPNQRRVFLAVAAAAILLFLGLVFLISFDDEITGHFHIDTAIRILLALAIGTICGRLPIAIAKLNLKKQDDASQTPAPTEPNGPSISAAESPERNISEQVDQRID